MASRQPQLGAASLAATLLVLAGGLVLIWFSAGNHPLHTPDEGRYGSVSQTMARGGEWLVPHFRGQPHLTKPPLTYWAQAACMRLGETRVGAWLGLGPESEFAVRLPSLLAGSATLILLWWWTRRIRGGLAAAVTTGLYAVMLEPLVVSRLGTPDAMLALAWFAGLAFGFLAVEERRPLWWIPAWLAVGMAAMLKGPIAPAPIVILGAWLVLGRRWRDLRGLLLHAAWGAPLALAPAAAWVWQVIERHPQAWAVWKSQFIDRFISGSPPQPLPVAAGGPPPEALLDAADAEAGRDPLWTYLPIFLAGMFPATCMLTLPWFNVRWRAALRAPTLGTLDALLLVAVAGPLLFFSLAAGKMPTYINPVAAPLAVLVGGMLTRVAARTWTPAAPGDEPPDVRVTFLVASIGVAVGAAVTAVVLAGPGALPWVVPFAALPLGAMRLLAAWRGDARRRLEGLVMAWLSTAAMLLWTLVLEDVALDAMGARTLIRAARDVHSGAAPQVVMYALKNPTVDFYAGRAPRMVWSVGDLRGVWPELERNHLVLVAEPTWEWMRREYPVLSASLEARPLPMGPEGQPSARWVRWFMKPTMVLRMTGQPGQDRERPEAEISREPRE